MKRIGRRPFLIGSSLLSACGGAIAEEPQPNTSPTPVPADPPEGNPPDPLPEYCIDRAPQSPVRALHGIGNDNPYPKGTLYSFTTAAQVAELRKGSPVFSKVTTDSGYRGLVFDILERSAPTFDLAELLAGPMFEKGRFAWPFLAGTRISPEEYGDEIIAFTLKPEALVATVSATRGMSFFDAESGYVSASDVRPEPERIAAIYFVNDSDVVSLGSLGVAACRPDTVGEALIYREFYLGNLAMVAEWSLGTQAILDHLAHEVADLRALARDLDCAGGRLAPGCDEVVTSWDRLHSGGRLDQFLASLAFASPLGRSGLMPRDLSALADDLETLRFEPDPLVVRP